MNAIFIPSDTIEVCDSVVIKLMKVTETNLPIIQEAETNCKDVWIVAIICFAVVIALVIVSFVCYLWLDVKHRYLKETDDQKYQHEKDYAALDAERKKTEKDEELNRYIRKRQFDIDKEESLWKNKNDYQKAAEFFDQLCKAIKDKDGKLNSVILEKLLEFFLKEWRCSEKVTNPDET